MATKHELEGLVSDMRAYNLRRPPPHSDPDIAGVWVRQLGGYPIEELRSALDSLLSGSEESSWWPTPVELRQALRRKRATQEESRREVARAGGCASCEQSGVRTVVQWVLVMSPAGHSLLDDLGYPWIRRIRSRVAACDCPAGQVYQGIVPWRKLANNAGRPHDARVYVSGSSWRYHADDCSPSGLWFAQPSPEELHGPRRAEGMRALAYQVRDAGPDAPKMAVRLIRERMRRMG